MRPSVGLSDQVIERVLRERNGCTLPFVFKSKAQSIAMIGEYVAPTATVYA